MCGCSTKTPKKSVQKLYITNDELPHLLADLLAKVSSKRRSRDASISPDFMAKVMHPH